MKIGAVVIRRVLLSDAHRETLTMTRPRLLAALVAALILPTLARAGQDPAGTDPAARRPGALLRG